MNTLAAYVNGGGNTTGLTFKQTQDITFDTVAEGQSNFTAIGSADNYFKGTFDGDGYTISDLTINSSSDYQGMFGVVGTTGMILNVNLVDANVNGRYGVGGLVGENYYGTVENSLVDGGSVSGENDVGGLAGYNYYGTVENCTTTGGTVSGNYLVGGLVGYNDSGTVKNSLVDGGSVSGDEYIGGLVGYNNNGTVSGYYHNISKFEGSGTATEVYLLTLPDGVTATSDKLHEFGGNYYAENEALIALENNNLSLKDADGTSFSNIYSMPAKDSILFLSTETLPATISATIDGQTVTLKYGVDEQGIPYYKISSVNDLKVLADYVNGGGDTTGLTFKQTQDIDLDGVNFTPIGWYDNDSYTFYYFKGTYDGGGHTIKKLTIDGAGSLNLGLFGGVGVDGMIKNVNLVDVNVNGGDENWYVGALVGENKGGSVENCTTTGGTVSSTGYAVGGLVGGINVAIIENCTATGVTVKGNQNVGGIAGCLFGAVVNCTTTGGSVSGKYTSGGLVGENQGIVVNSLVYNVTVKDGDYGNYVGGFVGKNNGPGKVENCLIDGGSVSGDFRVGTFVGENEGDTISGYYHNISKFEGSGTATQVYLLTLPDGVTASGGISFGGNYYAEEGATITLSGSGENVFFKGTDNKFVVDNSYTMPASDSELTEIPTISAEVDGQTVTLNFVVEDPINGYYEISSVNDLKALAAHVNAGNDCAGLNFKQTADIDIADVAVMNDFAGTFDGDSHLLINADINIFDNGTVRNLYYHGEATISGATKVYTLTLPTGVTAQGSIFVTVGDTDYYSGAVTLTIGAGTALGNVTDISNVAADSNEQVTFNIASDVTITDENIFYAVTVNGATISGNSINIGGTDYYNGEVTLTAKTGYTIDSTTATINEVTTINATLDTANHYVLANDTSTLATVDNTTTYPDLVQVYELTLPDGVTAQGSIFITVGDKTYAAGSVTLAGNRITDNASYAIVGNTTYTITKDKTIDVDVYISVNGGTYSNTTENISVIGGDGNEILINTAANVTLNGGLGDDSLVGSDNTEVFVYGGGVDSIKSFTSSDDKIRLADGFEVSGDPQVDDDNLTINFADGGKLIIEGAANLNSIDLYNADGSNYQTITIEDIVFNNTNKPLATGATVKSAYGDLSKYGGVYSITARQENSQLVANAKNNTIVISGGNENVLTGGLGNDTYNFSAGGGIVTDYGIGATKNGDGTAATANGTDIVKVDGKVTGIYFERDGNTKKDPTFTATIVYDNDEIIVLKDIVKKPTKTGSSPIYQTNDVAAATLKIWDTSGSKQAVLSATKLKNLFHDDNELTDTQQEQVNHLSELVQPKTDVTATSNGLQSSNPFATQLTFTGNKSKN